MSQAWKTIKIFISSTFHDMHTERDHLVRFVFPELKEKCIKKRIHLIDVDLRWGITEEDAQNGKALDICLDEIDSCRPFFLGLLGHRYGWVPPGEKNSITASEFYHGVLQNDIPRQIIDLRKIIEGNLDNKTLSSKQKSCLKSSYVWNGEKGKHLLKDNVSTEEMKILRDIFQSYSIYQRDRSFFFFRSESFSRQLAGDNMDHFFETSENGIKNLESLKKDVVDAKLAWFDYNDIETFSSKVAEVLWRHIANDVGETVELKSNWFQIENESHDLFIVENTHRFVGRIDSLNTMNRFCEKLNDSNIMLITGEPGCGKSALMCKFTEQLITNNPDWLIIPHFIGSSSHSSNLRQLLRRFCAYLVEGKEIDEIPEDLNELITKFNFQLNKAKTQKKKVFVIDAINQLEETDYALDFTWLPDRIPDDIRIIISTLPGKAQDVLKQRYSKLEILKIGGLSTAEVEKFVKEYLHDIHKQFPTKEIESAFYEKIKTGNPLHIKVALEELRVFGHFDKIGEYIKNLPVKVEPLFNQVLERLESDFTPELIRDFMSFIACSRQGMTAEELQVLLAKYAPGNVRNTIPKKLPDLIWARLYRACKNYLFLRSDVIGFFHSQLKITVANRYLEENSFKENIHSQIANYFTPRWHEPYLRSLDHLPFHFIMAKKYREVINLLLSWDFCKAKLEFIGFLDLLDDFRSAIGISEINVNFIYYLLIRYRTLLQNNRIEHRLIVKEADKQNYSKALEYAYSLDNNEFRLYSLLYLLEKCRENNIPVPDSERFFRELEKCDTNYNLFPVEIKLLIEGEWNLLDRYLKNHNHRLLNVIFKKIADKKNTNIDINKFLGHLLNVSHPLYSLDTSRVINWLSNLILLLSGNNADPPVHYIIKIFENCFFEGSDKYYSFLCRNVLELSRTGNKAIAEGLISYMIGKLKKEKLSADIVILLRNTLETDIELGDFLDLIAVALKSEDKFLNETFAGVLTKVMEEFNSSESVKLEYNINISKSTHMHLEPPKRGIFEIPENRESVHKWVFENVLLIDCLEPYASKLVREIEKLDATDLSVAELRFLVIRYLIKCNEIERARSICPDDLMPGIVIEVLGVKLDKEKSKFAEDYFMDILEAHQDNLLVLEYGFLEIFTLLIAGIKDRGEQVAKKLIEKSKQVRVSIEVPLAKKTYIEYIGNRSDLFAIALYECSEISSFFKVFKVFKDGIKDYSLKGYLEFLDLVTSSASRKQREDPERFDMFLNDILESILSVPYSTETPLEGILNSFTNHGNKDQLARLDQYLFGYLNDTGQTSIHTFKVLSLAVKSRIILGKGQCWDWLMEPRPGNYFYRLALENVIADFGDTIPSEMVLDWLNAVQPEIKNVPGLRNLVVEKLFNISKPDLSWSILLELESFINNDSKLNNLPQSTAIYISHLHNGVWKTYIQKLYKYGIGPKTANDKVLFIRSLIDNSDNILVVLQFIEQENIFPKPSEVSLEEFEYRSLFVKLIKSTLKIPVNEAQVWINKIFSWFGKDTMGIDVWNSFCNKPNESSRSGEMETIYIALDRAWPEAAHKAALYYLENYDYSSNFAANLIVKTLWKYEGDAFMEKILESILTYRDYRLGIDVNNSLLNSWIEGGWVCTKRSLPLLNKNISQIESFIEQYYNDSDRSTSYFYIFMLIFESWHSISDFFKCRDTLMDYLNKSIKYLMRNENKNTGGLPGFKMFNDANLNQLLILQRTTRSSFEVNKVYRSLRQFLLEKVGDKKSYSITPDMLIYMLNFEIDKSLSAYINPTFEIVLKGIVDDPDDFYSYLNLGNLIKIQTKYFPDDGNKLRYDNAILTFYKKHTDLSHIESIVNSPAGSNVSGITKGHLLSLLQEASRTRPELVKIYTESINNEKGKREYLSAREVVLNNLNNSKLDSSLQELFKKSQGKIVINDEFWLKVLEPSQDRISIRYDPTRINNLWIQLGFGEKLKERNPFGKILNREEIGLLIENGNNLHKEGKFKEGILSFSKVVEDDPGNDSAKNKLCDIYNDWGNKLIADNLLDEALARYDLALKINPAYKFAIANKSSIFLKQEKFEKAVDSCKEALKIDPQFIWAKNKLCDIYNDWGNKLLADNLLDDALARYDFALKINPVNKFVLGNKSIIFHKQEKFEDAVDSCKEALKIDPEYIWAKNTLCDIYNDWGNKLIVDNLLDDALARYELALKLNPVNKFVIGNKSTIFLKQEKFENAVECCKEALKIDPEYIWAKNRLCDIYNDWGNKLLADNLLDDALARYDLALILNPAYKFAMANKSTVFLRHGKFEKAVESCEEAIKIDPEYVWAKNKLCVIYNDWGNKLMVDNLLDDALTKYDLALKINPINKYAMANKGNVYQKQKDFDKAVKCYLKAIEIDPNYDWAKSKLKQIKDSLGKT